MTTNAGAADMASQGIGFGDVSKEDASEEAVKRMFTPEFRNRLDAIVPFGYLGKDTVARVVDKFILQLELQLAEQNVDIQFDKEARAWLADKGYDRLFGARRGTIATAVIGGAYSSTAVTHSFAQRLGASAGHGAENAGIALASAVMYLRVIILVAVLATSLLADFAILVAPALLAGFAAAFWLYRAAPATTGPAPPGNPIAMLPALTFVAFVAVAAVAARWAETRFGEEGIAVLLLLMGSMDVDAAIVTAAGLEPGTIPPRLAALAIAGTILANMSVKLGVTLAYGGREARPAAWALGASMVALAASLAAGYMRL